MTSPSAHQGYITIAGRALRGRESIPAMSDWEIFLHGFCDTNQNGDSRQIYDCLIDLFPTPEAVLDWPVTDRVTGDPLELPEAGWNGEPGGCANFRSRVGAGGWLRTNVEPANWRKIRSLMRCKRRDGSQIPGRQDQAKDFSNGSRLKRDGTRDEPGGLNYQLRAAIAGAGMKGADMHLLWGGCEVPVIDIQLIRYMAPHKLGMEMREYARQKLIVLKAEGYSLELNADRPKAQRTTIAAEDIETDEIPQSNDEAAIRKAQGATAHISAMERQEVSAIQNSQPLYGEWRDFAYEMAEKEDLKANVWHVANWMEFRQSGGDPDRKGRRSQAVIAGDAARLTDTLEFANRTFGPTDFPDAPAEWPLPNVRYPRRERRNRLARLRAEGFSIPAMAVEEGISQRDVVSDLAYYDRILAGRDTPSEDASPDAWFNRRSDKVRKAIEAGGGITIKIPYGGSDISEEEFFSMLHYMPDYHNNYTPGQREFWIAAGPRTEEARQIRNALYDLHQMRADYQRRQLRGEIVNVELRDEIKQLYRQWANQNPLVLTPDQRAYFIPPSVEDLSDLDSVIADVEGLKRDLQNNDREMWRAYMEGEQDAIDRGLQSPSAVTNDQMNYLNAEINDLTDYGQRDDYVERGRGPAYKLVWSSARAEWDVFNRLRVGATTRLDANQFIGYGKKADLEEAMPLLDPLPLYYGGPKGGSYNYKREQYPGAFVGFETPFGFDDNISVMWQDWVQYKIGDTPVIVRRVDTKPGTKINPRYKGATAPKELQIDFRLRASNRKDMQKVDFLLERLREDNPNMTVKVNVKTNGSTAKRNLPSWQERPYRLAPADYGVSEDPAAKMPFMDDDEGPEGISGPFAAGTARMWDWYRRMEQDVAKQVRDGILTDAQAERDMELIVLERDQEIENLRRETGGGTWAGLTEEIARRVRVAERLYSEWQRETFEKMNAGTITGEEAARRLGEDKKDYEGELDIIRRELGSRPEGNIKYTDPDYRDPSRASTPFDGIDSYANDIMELV